MVILRNGQKAGALGNKKASSKSIAQYSLDGNLIAIHKGIREVERLNGYAHQSIGRVCLGKQKKQLMAIFGNLFDYEDTDI